MRIFRRSVAVKRFGTLELNGDSVVFISQLRASAMLLLLIVGN